MSNTMALNLIAAIMGWPNEVADREFEWLQLVARVKFDGYSDFRAGSRFLENLAVWLKQFKMPAERQTAYAFVKKRLVYISPAELQKIIDAFVPQVVMPLVRERVAIDFEVKPYEVWSRADTKQAVDKHLRRALIVGMSDGSRIDVLRRSNAKRLTTEQVVPMMNIDNEKWVDLGKNLTAESGPGAQFTDVYLIDDFTASGTTFIRKVDGEWKGKLKKFNSIILQARKALADQGKPFPIKDKFTIHIHHYISSNQAREKLDELLAVAQAEWEEKVYGDYKLTEGMRLPADLKLGSGDTAMLAVGDAYYDHALFERLEKHCREAGQADMKLGYANCALPIVLDHNTPNNTIPLIWADTPGDGGAHAMVPLFRRRDRHG